MVKRIYPVIQADDPAAAQSFYGDILGLEILMDQGWVRTMGSTQSMAPQLTIAKHSGSGAPMADLSVEVDDFDDVLAAVNEAGLKIEYGPVTEPWGLRRFFVRDPFGKYFSSYIAVLLAEGISWAFPLVACPLDTYIAPV